MIIRLQLDVRVMQRREDRKNWRNLASEITDTSAPVSASINIGKALTFNSTVIVNGGGVGIQSKMEKVQFLNWRQLLI